MNIRAAIVDDEPLARESLKLLLAKHEDVEIVGEARHGRDAIAVIRARRPDVVFLDIQMPGMSGLDVLREIDPASAAFVFVTAYDRYAIDAFERRALDYLLKPYTDARFDEVLARVREHLKARSLQQLGERVVAMLAETAPAAGAGGTLAIKDGRRTLLLPWADIEWIEASDYYARVHARGTSHLLRESLKSLERSLDPARFVRVHRSAIVNRERVRAIETLPSGDAIAVLDSGERVRVSRACRPSLISRESPPYSTAD